MFGSQNLVLPPIISFYIICWLVYIHHFDSVIIDPVGFVFVFPDISSRDVK